MLSIKFQDISHQLRLIAYCWVSVLLLLVSGCQVENEGADSNSVPGWDGPTTSSYSTTIVDKLETDLVSAGLTSTEALVLKAGAITQLSSDGNATSIDINEVAPSIVKGAEIAISSSDAGLTAAKKIIALNTIATSITESLTVIVNASPSYKGSSPAPHFALSQSQYGTLLGLISSTLVENINNTGISSGAIENALGGVIKSLASSISVSDIDDTGYELIASGAMGALDSAGLTSSVNTVSSQIIDGIMEGLDTTTLSDAQIASFSDDIAKGAIEALDEAGVLSANVAEVAGIIATDVVSNLDVAEVDDVIQYITQVSIAALLNSGVGAGDLTTAISEVKVGIETGVTNSGADLEALRTSINNGADAGRDDIAAGGGSLPSCYLGTEALGSCRLGSQNS